MCPVPAATLKGPAAARSKPLKPHSEQAKPTVRETLQTRPVDVDGKQVAVGLELVRQGDLLGRVAGVVAGEHNAARLWGELG